MGEKFAIFALLATVGWLPVQAMIVAAAHPRKGLRRGIYLRRMLILLLGWIAGTTTAIALLSRIEISEEQILPVLLILAGYLALLLFLQFRASVNTVYRLHDLGRSRWWALLMGLAGVNFLLALTLVFLNRPLGSRAPSAWPGRGSGVPIH